MAETGGYPALRNRAGWRHLSWFWLAVLSLLGAGSGVLQYLGPPGPEGQHALPRELHTPPGNQTGSATIRNETVVAGVRPVAPVVAGRDTPGPIADPDPALLQPLAEGSKENLPRIAADGRPSMQVYAAGFDHSSRRPRIGLLLGGIGLNEAESDAAIRALPGAVSLAVSPYAWNMTRLLETARASGHEYLIQVPLEPTGFPLNDPGPDTLLTSLPPSANAQYLHWALSRIDGYVGATGVIGTMRGERLAAMTDQMDAVLSEFAGRGLLYVDPRPGNGTALEGVPRTWGRHVELVIDDPADQGVADRAMIDAKLAELEQRAKDNGSALGLVMQPTPAAVARIAAWSNGLADRGLALAPVSALVQPPAESPVKLSERE
jgi:polysaccharide deacetylase 2 family uncharacterized protein YibQ